MKYYLVLCKAGHVGKSKYIPIWFPVYAESGRQAALIARSIPRVKHDHMDAILDVREVSYEEYKAQEEINNKDLYLQCMSRHEQNKIFDLIKDRLVDDCHPQEIEKSRMVDRHRKPNFIYQQMKYYCRFRKESCVY